MDASIDEELLEIAQSLFGDEISSLADADGPETIDGWDSAGHLNFITAVEMQFGVEFDVADFSNLTSIGQIRQALEEKLAQ